MRSTVLALALLSATAAPACVMENNRSTMTQETSIDWEWVEIGLGLAVGIAALAFYAVMQG